MTKNSSTSLSGGGMAGMGSMGGSATSGSNTSYSSSMSGMSSSGGSMSSGMNDASPGMSDVLRIQLEMIEIENNIESLMSDIAAEKAKFNAFNRPVDSEVIVPDSIVKVLLFSMKVFL